MADDLKSKGPEDPHKINVNQSWELEYWSKKLGVTQAHLKNVVGPTVKAVRTHLGK